LSDVALARAAPAIPVGAVVGTALAALYAGLLASGAASVFVWGGAYWFLPRGERPDHPLHEWLRPGGPVGLWLGVIGTTLMIVMLVYTLRKAAPRARWLGPVPAWLRFHMICGVMGPIYVALHAGLMWPRGVVAVAFWCMVLVAASGVFGRYVYGFFPRNAAGRVEDLDDAREELAVLREDLVVATAGHTGAGRAIAEAVDLSREIDRPRSLLGLLAMGFEVRRRARRIRSLLARTSLAPAIRRRVARDLVDQLRMARSLAAWEVSVRLFRYWHLFHLPLAKAMYAIALLHVITALVFGGALAGLWAWPGEGP
jgi:hypothetical protein